MKLARIQSLHYFAIQKKKKKKKQQQQQRMLALGQVSIDI